MRKTKPARNAPSPHRTPNKCPNHVFPRRLRIDFLMFSSDAIPPINAVTVFLYRFGPFLETSKIRTAFYAKSVVWYMFANLSRNEAPVRKQEGQRWQNRLQENSPTVLKSISGFLIHFHQQDFLWIPQIITLLFIAFICRLYKFFFLLSISSLIIRIGLFISIK